MESRSNPDRLVVRSGHGLFFNQLIEEGFRLFEGGNILRLIPLGFVREFKHLQIDDLGLADNTDNLANLFFQEKMHDFPEGADGAEMADPASGEIGDHRKTRFEVGDTEANIGIESFRFLF